MCRAEWQPVHAFTSVCWAMWCGVPHDSHLLRKLGPHLTRHTTLTQGAGSDGLVSCSVYVSALIGAFKFARFLRMDRRLKRLYQCFEGAESDRVDYRETVVCLRILADYNEIPKRSKQLLRRYYELFAMEADHTKAKRALRRDYDGDATQLRDAEKPITRDSALRLIGVCAESDSEMVETRGELIKGLEKYARRFGLKPSSKVIPYGLFWEIVEHVPQLVTAFKDCMWRRVRDEQRLDYIKQEEEGAMQRFEYVDGLVMFTSQSLVRSTMCDT